MDAQTFNGYEQLPRSQIKLEWIGDQKRFEIDANNIFRSVKELYHIPNHLPKWNILKY